MSTVRSRLARDTYEETLAMGAGLRREDVTAKARDLVESVPGTGDGVVVLRADRA